MGWLLSRDALDIVVVVVKILEYEMMRRDRDIEHVHSTLQCYS